MTAPVRLQLSRRKGFNLQALSQATNGLPAVKVTRRGPWGNPFEVWQDTYESAPNWHVSDGPCHWGPFTTKAEAVAEAVRLHRAEITVEGPHNHRLKRPVPTRSDIIKALRGKNLACWCALSAPCHADVLLELANRPICDDPTPSAQGSGR